MQHKRLTYKNIIKCAGRPLLHHVLHDGLDGSKVLILKRQNDLAETPHL